MPMGHSFSIYMRFSRQKRTSVYVYLSGKRRSLLHPNMVQQFFFPIISILFLGNFKEKFTQKACM